MNIMELGAIGELVGGLAMIGSLIYVGFQVRQNTRWLSSVAVNEYTQRAIDLHVLFSYADTARINNAIMRDPSSLEEENRRVPRSSSWLFFEPTKRDFTSMKADSFLSTCGRDSIAHRDAAESRAGAGFQLYSGDDMTTSGSDLGRRSTALDCFRNT